MDKIKIRKTVETIIEDVAKGLGFKDEYQRKCSNWGYDQIVSSQINVFALDDSFRIVMSLVRRVNQIESLWEDFGKAVNLPSEGNGTFTLTALHSYPELTSEPYCHEGTGWVKFRANKAGFGEFKEFAEFIYREKILPKGEEYSDLKKLDAHINSKIELEDDLTKYIFNTDGLIFRRIILARKSENPLFEGICKYQRSFFDEYERLSTNPGLEYFKNYPTVFENVYERLSM